MKTVVLSINELLLWVRENIPHGVIRGILFAGDRISCLDEAVGLTTVKGEVVGVATIAPEGEMMEGQPTIVAIYVLPTERRKGYGKALLQATIERCLERDFARIRVDVMSSYAMRTISALPEHILAALDVHDQSGTMDFFAELEEKNGSV